MSAEDFKSYTEIGERNYSEVRRWDMTAYKVEFLTFNRKLLSYLSLIYTPNT